MNFTIPLKTRSLTNLRVHWAVKAKEAKKHRTAVMRKCPPWDGPPLLLVTLTRVAPRELDPGDNLPSALKSIRDGVAGRLKLDDRSPLVRFEYAQAKCKTGEERVDVAIEVIDRKVTASASAPQLCDPSCDDPSCRGHFKKPRQSVF